jgi:SAM-dependent methyltransferase
MADDRPGGTTNPFRVPSGPLGRLAGWFMGRDDSAHRELVALLAPASAARICQVGFGPGQLLTVLTARGAAIRLCGVDPSPVMLEQARRRLERAGAAGRADLRLEVAGGLPTRPPWPASSGPHHPRHRVGPSARYM